MERSTPGTGRAVEEVAAGAAGEESSTRPIQPVRALRGKEFSPDVSRSTHGGRAGATMGARQSPTRGESVSARRVELFVDPVCPFAWMTSRWLLHAAEVREIEPVYSVMSLSVLNEGRELDPGYRAMLDDSWGPARLAIAIREAEGNEAFARWYTAWGERYHVGGQNEDRRATAVAALADADLPAELIETYEPVAGDEIDTALRASHEGATSRVGDEVGTPVISFGEGTAYFGPVVSPAPRGEDAGKLLDALATLASIDGFYELKRSRSGGVDLS